MVAAATKIATLAASVGIPVVLLFEKTIKGPVAHGFCSPSVSMRMVSTIVVLTIFHPTFTTCFQSGTGSGVGMLKTMG
jgi:acyl dehydratase